MINDMIIEYKRSTNENVINQGLFYLDWLLDHKAEFELLVTRVLGQTVADTIEWSAPRLVCIAGDFTKYDQHAVQQISRNIELIKYKRYGTELLLLDLVHSVTVDMDASGATSTSNGDRAVDILTPLVYQIIKDEGFETNHEKTMVMRHCSRQVVTGLVVNETPRVSRRDMRRFRAIAHQCRTLGHAQTTEKLGRDAKQYLLGYISYVRMVNKEQAEQLAALVDFL
jgi:hypothetical protein